MATESELMLGECSASKFIGEKHHLQKFGVGEKSAWAIVVRLSHGVVRLFSGVVPAWASVGPYPQNFIYASNEFWEFGE